MAERVFWLHEDEWGMISLMPAENYENAERLAHEAAESSAQHADDAGWTNIDAPPEPEHPLVKRQLSLDALRTLIDNRLPEANRVETGITPGEMESPAGFAFGADELGAFYGEQSNGIIEHLYVIPPERIRRDLRQFWIETLTALGATYQLVLADWRRNAIVDLTNHARLDDYIAPWFTRTRGR